MGYSESGSACCLSPLLDSRISPGVRAGLYPLLCFCCIVGIPDAGKDLLGRNLSEAMLILKVTFLAWRKELYPGLGGWYLGESRGSRVNPTQTTLNGFPSEKGVLLLEGVRERGSTPQVSTCQASRFNSQSKTSSCTSKL